jgi:hypothetical protein
MALSVLERYQGEEVDIVAKWESGILPKMDSIVTNFFGVKFIIISVTEDEVVCSPFYAPKEIEHWSSVQFKACFLVRSL